MLLSIIRATSSDHDYLEVCLKREAARFRERIHI
jgi:hypothetical protein